MREAQIEASHDVVGIGNARQERDTPSDCGTTQTFGKFWRDDEFRSCVDCCRKIGFVEDCARSDNGTVNRLHCPGGIESRRRPQCDLDRGNCPTGQGSG